MGRFINADGIIGTGGIMGYNMFAYCNNNPIAYIDASGECPHDGRFYEDGIFKGMHRYNANCNLCKSHGCYSLTATDGTEFVFYNAYDLDKERQLIEFIAGYESFSSTPTSDGCIGFGCSIKDNQKALKEVLGTTSPTEITLAEAYKLLQYVVNIHINQLYDDHLSEIIDMSVDQIHALVSFSYNVGNASNILNAIANNMCLYDAWTTTNVRSGRVILNGLVKRRAGEFRIYIFGEYDSNH